MQGNWGVPRRKNPGDAEAVRKGSSPEEEFEVDLEAWETVLEDRKVVYSSGQEQPAHGARPGSPVRQSRPAQQGFIHVSLYMCMRVCVCV